jgi:hypothetical protein
LLLINLQYYKLHNQSFDYLQKSPFEPVPCWSRRPPRSPPNTSMRVGPSRPSRECARSPCRSHQPDLVCRHRLPLRHPRGIEPSGEHHGGTRSAPRCPRRCRDPGFGGCMSRWTSPTGPIGHLLPLQRPHDTEPMKRIGYCRLHTHDSTSPWSSSTHSYCTYAADLDPPYARIWRRKNKHMNWLGVVAKDEGACGDGWRAEWGENDGAGADRVGLRSTVGGKPSRERRVIFFVFF